MHNLYDLAKITHDEKLRVAARDHAHGRAYAARRAGNKGNPACRLEDRRVLRGRRAAPCLLGGTVKYMMTARPGPAIGRFPGGSSADAGSWAAREHAIIGDLYGKRD